MNPVWLIAKKRDGEELTSDEIGVFIAGYAKGDIPDYQMSALAMAIYIKGMTAAETAALTDHMLASGARFSWPADGIKRVDKHSTGGIGDKVSLPLSARTSQWMSSATCASAWVASSPEPRPISSPPTASSTPSAM
jgi:thymidine phosphorylase